MQYNTVAGNMKLEMREEEALWLLRNMLLLVCLSR